MRRAAGGFLLALAGMVGALAIARAADETSITPPAPAPAPVPAIRFDAPTHDFGRVVVGTVLHHTFTFTNTGAAPLHISDVRSSCGCTTSGAWTKQVAPGMAGSIPIEFHTVSFTGPVTKSIDVESDDPAQPSVVLTVTADVWRPILIQPPSAVVRVILDSPTNPPAVVRITSNEEGPLELSEPVSDHPSLVAKLTEVEPGESFDLSVTAVPPIGRGNVFAKITMKTSSAAMPTISVPAYIVAHPAVVVSPQQIRLPAGILKTNVVRDVSIRCLATSELVISEPEINVAGVTGQVTELQRGRLYSLRLVFPEGLELDGKREAAVTLKSNQPQFATIKIPITQSAVAVRKN
jgi:hypothetical protein